MIIFIYTSLCLSIICNRYFFFLLNDVSFVPVRVIHKDEKTLGRKHIYLPHAQTAIYNSEVKLFLKQGISRQLDHGWMHLFDLNAINQKLTWSLIFYEKYSTRHWNFHWPDKKNHRPRAIRPPLISNTADEYMLILLLQYCNNFFFIHFQGVDNIDRENLKDIAQVALYAPFIFRYYKEREVLLWI